MTFKSNFNLKEKTMFRNILVAIRNSAALTAMAFLIIAGFIVANAPVFFGILFITGSAILMLKTLTLVSAGVALAGNTGWLLWNSRKAKREHVSHKVETPKSPKRTPRNRKPKSE